MIKGKKSLFVIAAAMALLTAIGLVAASGLGRGSGLVDDNAVTSSYSQNPEFTDVVSADLLLASPSVQREENGVTAITSSPADPEKSWRHLEPLSRLDVYASAENQVADLGLGVLGGEADPPASAGLMTAAAPCASGDCGPRNVSSFDFFSA